MTLKPSKPIDPEFIYLIANNLCIEDAEVTANARLDDDLHGDELDLVQIIIDCEDKYEVTIPDEYEMEHLSVQAFYDYVMELKNAPVPET